MGTTVWVDDNIRAALRRLQGEFGTDSVNSTIHRLIHQPVPDAYGIFAKHKAEIQAILRRHDLRRLIAFGSRARGDASTTSDLDLAVEAGPRTKPLAILSAEAELEATLGMKVNLVELPNPRLAGALRREGVPFAR